MSWSEASYTINKVLDGVKQYGTSSKAVLLITTTSSNYAGQVCHADLTNGFETYSATFESIGDDTYQAVIYTPYIGTYKIYVEPTTYIALQVAELGQVVEGKLNQYTLYGFHCAGALTDPTAKITYIQGCANEGFSPVQMDFTTGIIDGGDWFDVDVVDNKPILRNVPFFFPRSCMLTTAGVVSYYLDEVDESKTEDGATSDYNNTAYDGNCMVEFGQNDSIIWTKWEPDENDSTSGSFYVCDKQLDSGFENYAFRDKDNNQTEHFYISKYFGSGSASRMRSLSGQANYVNGTADNEVAGARANGADHHDTVTLAQWQLINGLLVMMAKSTNTQSVYGRGRCKSSNSSAINTGTMDGKGMFWGSTDETSGVKVFGIENWWGNLWNRIRGYINNRGTIQIKLTRGTYDGTTVSDYNTSGSGYISLSDCTPSGTSEGYISQMQFNEYGMFAKVASGSETTQYCDGYWFNNSQVNYAVVGGDWYAASLDGALSARVLNAPSYAPTDIGARLSYT